MVFPAVILCHVCICTLAINDTPRVVGHILFIEKNLKKKQINTKMQILINLHLISDINNFKISDFILLLIWKCEKCYNYECLPP